MADKTTSLLQAQVTQEQKEMVEKVAEMNYTNAAAIVRKATLEYCELCLSQKEEE